VKIKFKEEIKVSIFPHTMISLEQPLQFPNYVFEDFIT